MPNGLISLLRGSQKLLRVEVF